MTKPINIYGLSSYEVFLMIIGLERVRDFEKEEHKRYASMPGWEETAKHALAESNRAEDLRWKLKDLVGYDVDEAHPPEETS